MKFILLKQEGHHRGVVHPDQDIKATALTVVGAGYSLSLLGVMDTPIQEVIGQAIAFMSACYRHSSSESMSEARCMGIQNRTCFTIPAETVLSSSNQ